MEIRKLAIQEQKALLPTQLDFYRILNLRGTTHFQEEKERCKSLEAGFIGEEKVLAYLEEHGHSDWIVLRNVWLKDFAQFECDFILLTAVGVYILEVKNYNGVFTYDQGKCYYDNFETSLNPIEQVRGNVVQLKKILAKIFPHLEVKAAVIFAGEDHEVHMQTPVDDIEIVTSNGLRNFILRIVKKEERIYQRSFDAKRLLQHLNRYEIENPFRPKPLTPGEMKEIRGGIYCANCHSFDVNISKFEVDCTCGLTESREEAIVRTICDYGVLNYESELTRGELMRFFNQQVSISLLKDTLKKHFTLIKKTRFSYYLNLKLPFWKIRYLFSFEKPCTLEKNYGDMTVFHS